MGENTRRDRRTKVLSMTVRYRSATLGEFIEHHSYDVSRGGMFIKTPSPFPPGTLLKFEVKIAEEQRVMQGVGRVVWKRDERAPESEEPAGMGIKFIKIDEASRTVIDKLVEERGDGTKGAFDNSPEPKQAKMFPESEGELPAPEDRTVLKPAHQLLQDALKVTGADAPGGDDATQANGGDSSEEKGREPSIQEEPASRRAAAEQEKKKAATALANAAKTDDEGGGGRAVLSVLAAALVAGGIYVATKPSAAPTPTRETDSPALSASDSPSLAQEAAETDPEDLEQPTARQAQSESATGGSTADASPSGGSPDDEAKLPSAAEAAPATAPRTVTKPKPSPRPRPAAKPRPTKNATAPPKSPVASPSEPKVDAPSQPVTPTVAAPVSPSSESASSPETAPPGTGQASSPGPNQASADEAPEASP